MSFALNIDPRTASYLRLAGDVYDMLNDVVAEREAEGISRAEIARRMGKSRSQLSRILNGDTRNLSLRTIADILFATGYETDRLVWHRSDGDDSSDSVSETIPIHQLPWIAEA